MTNANDARKAHELLDELDARAELSQEQEKLLRSFLPDLPKQKTLKEIYKYVDDAWLEADDPESKEWLHELHAQLQGLKDTPATIPALPAGMRLATHPEYGLCVVSPTTDEDGERRIFYLSAGTDAGADCRWVPVVHLTFIGSEPAHPEFLETEADYAEAPEGTIVVSDGGVPCHKFHDKWSSAAFCAMKDDRGMSRACRRVLRWGNE